MIDLQKLCQEFSLSDKRRKSDVIIIIVSNCHSKPQLTRVFHKSINALSIGEGLFVDCQKRDKLQGYLFFSLQATVCWAAFNRSMDPIDL